MNLSIIVARPYPFSRVTSSLPVAWGATTHIRAAAPPSSVPGRGYRPRTASVLMVCPRFSRMNRLELLSQLQ